MGFICKFIQVNIRGKVFKSVGFCGVYSLGRFDLDSCRPSSSSFNLKV